MITMDLMELETPALLIEENIMKTNIRKMQEIADGWKVDLRPHTKTHKSTYIARHQKKAGAVGITVAKVSEAEVFADDGCTDIFISSEIVSRQNYEKIEEMLRRGVDLTFAVDSIDGLRSVHSHFSSLLPAQVLIEIDCGEQRTGVSDTHTFKALLDFIQDSKHITLRGIFGHEGHAYRAENERTVISIFRETQSIMARYAAIASHRNIVLERISIGSTPSILLAAARNEKLNPAITEIRPGTYVYMDVGQAMATGDCSSCAATVLTRVISKPTPSRVVGDSGAKALTMQTRDTGVCRTPGKGCIFGMEDVHVTNLYDEHTVIENEQFSSRIALGDIFRIVPNHICPAVNLYDHFYIVNGMRVIQKLKVDARGKSS